MSQFCNQCRSQTTVKIVYISYVTSLFHYNGTFQFGYVLFWPFAFIKFILCFTSLRNSVLLPFIHLL
jgi:hypothetical protein